MEQTINEFLSYLRDHVWLIALAAIFLLGVSFLCSRLCTHKRKIWEPFIASCIAVLGVVATVLAFVPKVDVEQSSEILRFLPPRKQTLRTLICPKAKKAESFS